MKIKLDLSNLKIKGIEKVIFDENKKILFDENQNGYLVQKAAAEIVKKEETMLINTIIDYAEKCGLTTLYLIDEEFVKTALKNEIKRRKRLNARQSD